MMKLQRRRPAWSLDELGTLASRPTEPRSCLCQKCRSTICLQTLSSSFTLQAPDLSRGFFLPESGKPSVVQHIVSSESRAGRRLSAQAEAALVILTGRQTSQGMSSWMRKRRRGKYPTFHAQIACLLRQLSLYRQHRSSACLLDCHN